MPEIITSVQNARIKELKKLLAKSSERRERGQFVIEGLREVLLAHRSDYEIAALFICEDILTEDRNYPLREVTQSKKQPPVFHVTQDVYNSLAYRETTEGIIALAIPKRHTLEKLRLSGNPLILVIEAAEKPGNLGAMLRTCDAVGVDAVIICDPQTDLYNPNIIRSSIGTVFTNQIAICETKDAIAYLESRGLSTYAAELTATKMCFESDFRNPSAIVVGSESNGLSDEWVKAAKHRIKIPMNGEIDSLNVSVSAAVLLYEALRQRGK